MRRQLILVLLIVFLLLAIGLITYFWNFHSNISTKSEDWSNFSHYLDFFVSFASLILIGYVSILTHSINERSAATATDNLNASRRFYRYQMMPILDLSVERSHQDFYPTYPDSWYIINCSLAAARNISLKFWIGQQESSCITLYSMSEKAKLELPWLRTASKIQLYYSDATAESFYVFEMEDLRGIIKEITKPEFDLLSKEKHCNVANVMLDFRKKFLAVKGKQLSDSEYSDFFESYRKS